MSAIRLNSIVFSGKELVNMSDFAILYSFRRCPYAMRARLAILVSGVQVELREILLKDKPASMRQYSPKATVPVLITPEIQVVDESYDVMLWALGQSDPHNWLDADRKVVNELVAENDGSFKQALDRYKYADRYPEFPAEHYRAQGLEFLQKLEVRLITHRFLVSDSITLADMAIFPFIRQFAFVDKPWFDNSNLPQLHRWLDYLLATDLFTRVMTKYPVWQEDDAPVIFGGV